jgi:aspartate kinase
MANTSEATVSMVTDREYGPDVLEAAAGVLGRLGRVHLERGKAIICVVGEELRGRAGVLGRIFEAVARRSIKARMVSQSDSEINVSFLVDNSQIRPAVTALHEILLGS